ncbi:hypothetical protein [Pseudoalteromonas rubra]|uniref:Uncharacterized protein n=1 Tax=Pseudoalteromonas rubra TaxID=43658 RepID=A0A0U2X0M4_9GAMM|nr:hypothetical protein [Pseudoalteromonas rubra]ALU41924.1 hypothetical protein AT705_02660 [Pseudoalteromonas rubra]
MENYDSEQENNIFESQTPPDCDVLAAFSHAVNACMRRSTFTRAGLADRMNRALQVHEVKVNEGNLNRWFAPSQPTNMPIQYLPALLWALKSIEPLNILIEPIIYKAVNQHALMMQDVAQADLQIAELQKHKQRLLEQLSPKS